MSLERRRQGGERLPFPNGQEFMDFLGIFDMQSGTAELTFKIIKKDRCLTHINASISCLSRPGLSRHQRRHHPLDPLSLNLPDISQAENAKTIR